MTARGGIADRKNQIGSAERRVFQRAADGVLEFVPRRQADPHRPQLALRDGDVDQRRHAHVGVVQRDERHDFGERAQILGCRHRRAVAHRPPHFRRRSRIERRFDRRAAIRNRPARDRGPSTHARPPARPALRSWPAPRRPEEPAARTMRGPGGTTAVRPTRRRSRTIPAPRSALEAPGLRSPSGTGRPPDVTSARVAPFTSGTRLMPLRSTWPARLNVPRAISLSTMILRSALATTAASGAAAGSAGARRSRSSSRLYSASDSVTDRD